MGDDLGDDFDYLVEGSNVGADDDGDYGYNFASEEDEKKKKSALNTSTVAVIEDDNSSNDDDVGKTSNKRKRKKDNGGEDISEVSKKSKQKPSRSKLLIEASRSIETDPSEKQAAFLWTTLVHYHQLKSGKAGATVDETELDPKLKA